jgi:hypothetical protein
MPTLADISRLSTEEAGLVRPHCNRTPRSRPLRGGWSTATLVRPPDPCVCRGRMLTVRGLSLVPAQLLHGAIHEMCGTAGRYAPGAKPLVVQYQALFQEATAKGLSPEEVWPPHPKCPCARNPTLRALVEACACAWNVRAC